MNKQLEDKINRTMDLLLECLYQATYNYKKPGQIDTNGISLYEDIAEFLVMHNKLTYIKDRFYKINDFNYN